MLATSLCAAGLGAGLLASSASAAVVTVGSPLSAAFEPAPINNDTVTLFNTVLPEPGAQIASPVNGVVVRWRVVATKGPHSLRVLRPAGGGAYTGVGTSVSQTPAGLGVETFPTDLPIHAGDTIGLQNDEPERTYLGFAKPPGALIDGWLPPLGEGETRQTLAASGGIPGEPGEIGLNADIQPAPVVSGLSPASGYFAGGTTLTISGSDFEGTTAVTIGGVPVAFALASESQLVATAPPIAYGAQVPVTLTTNAGSAVSPQLFGGTACKIPMVKGRHLKAAKTQLRAFGCAVGKLKKKGDATAKTGRVAGLGSKPGALLPPGTRVNVTLR